MESVGARELKARLGHYLGTVRQGNVLVITQHGKPVARLMPISHAETQTVPAELEEQLWALAGQGFLTWNGGAAHLPEAVAVNSSDQLLSDLLTEDRE